MPDEKDQYGYGVYEVNYQKEQQDALNKQYEFDHNVSWGTDYYNQSNSVSTYSANYVEDSRVKGKHTQRVLDGRNRGIIRDSRGGVSIRTGLFFFLVVIILLWLGSLSLNDSLLAGKAWESTRIAVKHLIDLSATIFIPVGIIITTVFIFLRKSFWKGTMSLIIAGLTIFFGTAVYLVLSGVFFGK